MIIFVVIIYTYYYMCYNLLTRRKAMKSYSSRDVIKILKADGWYEVNCTGDHHQFKHPIKKDVSLSPILKRTFHWQP